MQDESIFDEMIELIINIEAKNKDNPGYNLISRTIYYCGRLINRQKNSREGFKISKFDDIKKVYSIWICLNHDRFKDDVITKYSIKEDCIQRCARNPRFSYDLFIMVMLYLANNTIMKKRTGVFRDVECTVFFEPKRKL